MTTRVPLKNYQPVEKPVSAELSGGFLDAHSVFATIQGEGPCVGVPSIFIRLAGCNLQCPACDTDYTTGRKHTSPEALVDRVVNLPWPGGVKLWRGSDLPLVVITGGEPFRQPLGELVRRLLDHRFLVQIETNGTLYLEDFPYASPDVMIVCSPKTGKVNENLETWISAWKYVVSVSDGVEDDGLPSAVLGNRIRPARPYSKFSHTYVQPADEGDPDLNAANMQLAIKSCMENGYRLCIQTHKLCGLP